MHSVLIESSHQFRFIGDRGYVEPQVELTYGFVRGDDTTGGEIEHPYLFNVGLRYSF